MIGASPAFSCRLASGRSSNPTSRYELAAIDLFSFQALQQGPPGFGFHLEGLMKFGCFEVPPFCVLTGSAIVSVCCTSIREGPTEIGNQPPWVG
jgi:hypothetical protein